MKGRLLNSTKYNGKTYTIDDLAGLMDHDMGDSWYGGMIKKFGKTNDGIYLCLAYYGHEYHVADLFLPEE